MTDCESIEGVSGKCQFQTVVVAKSCGGAEMGDLPAESLPTRADYSNHDPKKSNIERERDE